MALLNIFMKVYFTLHWSMNCLDSSWVFSKCSCKNPKFHAVEQGPQGFIWTSSHSQGRSRQAETGEEHGWMVWTLMERVASIKRVVAPTWLCFVYLMLSRKSCQWFSTKPPKYDQETRPRDQFVRTPLFATETSSVLFAPNPGGLALRRLIFETSCEQQQQPWEVLGDTSDAIHALPTPSFRFTF